jgi:putative sigma-54 modulation protein
MQFNFVGKNIEITPALKAFTTEKFESLKKHYADIKHVNIVFHVEHIMQTVEATLHLQGYEIHASAKDPDMYKSIEMLMDKLLVQIKKRKEKIIEGHR